MRTTKTARVDLSPEGVAEALKQGGVNPYLGRASRVQRPDDMDPSHPQYHQVVSAWDYATRWEARMRTLIAEKAKEQAEIELYQSRMAEGEK